MLNERSYQLKKILFSFLKKDGVFKIELCGKQYKVKYEGSHIKAERDYKVMRWLGRDKKCVLDVGSNVGLSMLMLAEENQGQIHAFEASEFASRVIIEHAALNNLSGRVKVVNGLVSDQSGRVVPFYWDFSSGGASVFEDRLGHNFAINKITVALDDYTQQMQIQPDLIKIDVEGAELDVLKGCQKSIQKYQPVVFLELHTIGEELLWKNAERIIELMKPLSYSMVYLRNHNIIKNPEELADRGRCHVLLVPTDSDWKSMLTGLDLIGL
jgi:FkbM family methyltransferase